MRASGLSGQILYGVGACLLRGSSAAPRATSVFRGPQDSPRQSESTPTNGVLPSAVYVIWALACLPVTPLEITAGAQQRRCTVLRHHRKTCSRVPLLPAPIHLPTSVHRCTCSILTGYVPLYVRPRLPFRHTPDDGPHHNCQDSVVHPCLLPRTLPAARPRRALVQRQLKARIAQASPHRAHKALLLRPALCSSPLLYALARTQENTKLSSVCPPLSARSAQALPRLRRPRQALRAEPAAHRLCAPTDVLSRSSGAPPSPPTTCLGRSAADGGHSLALRPSLTDAPPPAGIVRMAPIPLFCKNYGLSLIPSCDVNTFTKATVLCNIPYTFVWAVTGASGETLTEARKPGMTSCRARHCLSASCWRTFSRRLRRHPCSIWRKPLVKPPHSHILPQVIHGTASGQGSLRDHVMLGMKVALTLVRAPRARSCPDQRAAERSRGEGKAHKLVLVAANPMRCLRRGARRS